MAAAKNRKVTRFPNRLQRILQDSGIILFTIIVIYMLACFIIYMTKTHISVYEVQHGSISKDYSYMGVVIRSEQIISADKSGYVTYYAREGEKVGAKSTVMAIDETGELSALMEQSTADTALLSAEDMLAFKEDVKSYQSSYDSMDFSAVYGFKQDLESRILESVHLKLLESATQSQDASSLMSIYKAARDGVLSFKIDGMEDLTQDSITQDTLKKSGYKATDLKNQTIVDTGDSVYKLITEDDWSVVISTDEEVAKRLEDESYIEVTFLKDNRTAWGEVETWKSGGDTYVKLSFTNSMVRYASERYLDIRFNLDDVEGLKVPVSAVKEESLYTIPREYLTKAGDQDSQGVYLEVHESDGSVSQKFKELDIVYQTESLVYVSMDDFDNGNTLLKPESTERYNIGKTEKLTGVYNINKGYTEFEPVEILCENEEYCIVRSDTAGGISQYDRIVLDADTAKDNKIIY